LARTLTNSGDLEGWSSLCTWLCKILPQ
jgi:hypothetical protein